MPRPIKIFASIVGIPVLLIILLVGYQAYANRSASRQATEFCARARTGEPIAPLLAPGAGWKGRPIHIRERSEYMFVFPGFGMDKAICTVTVAGDTVQTATARMFHDQAPNRTVERDARKSGVRLSLLTLGRTTYSSIVAYFYAPAEYLRPWKLASLAAGISLLIAGSIYTPAPDWDIPISIIMATCTYFTAPCSLRTLVERNWRLFPAAILATWFSVDGCYATYWHFKDPVALEFMRSANAPASLALYGICGVIWLYRGSLRDLYIELRNIVRPAKVP